MSRRLRASKASRRGRSLRPRSQRPSSLASEPSAEAPTPSPPKVVPEPPAPEPPTPAKKATPKKTRPEKAEAKPEPKELEEPVAISDPQIADTVKIPAAEAQIAVAAAKAIAEKKAEPQQKAKTKKKGRKTKAAKTPAGAPPPAFEDDISTVSATFFREQEDSFAPVTEEHHDDLDEVHTLSPATLARRGRMRRAVGGAIGVLGIIAVAVLGKALFEGGPETTAIAQAAPPAPEEEKPAAAPEQTPPAAPEAAPAPEPAEVAADADDADADDADADDADADAADADAADADAADADGADAEAAEATAGKDASELRKEALSLLNRGKRKEAIVAAESAIAADPSQALPYLYKGSALQDLGQWKKGIEAYSDCVRTATKGPVHECAAMGGHK